MIPAVDATLDDLLSDEPHYARNIEPGIPGHLQQAIRDFREAHADQVANYATLDKGYLRLNQEINQLREHIRHLEQAAKDYHWKGDPLPMGVLRAWLKEVPG